MYSQDEQLKREHIREHPNIVAILEMWWNQAKRIIHVHIDGEEDVLSRHEYEALYERLLLAFAEDDDDEVII